MYNIYDNGYKLLGRKKDIEDYESKLVKHYKEIGNNYVVETCEEILEIIKDYKDETIFVINYDNGMGFTYDTWIEKDKVIINYE